ncbi:hypothetical protein [Bradyrhizobium centrosematis]|uniref:hypothetical protein n=1 Tax=Bradyrhizobium centrosematis TaxID=1300039 RepID=UPI00388F46D0
MTIGMVIGLILLPFAWALLAAANKAHRAETGVDAPTRTAMRNIRRNARRKGISEEQVYGQWLQRQQRRPSSSAPPSLPGEFSYFAAPPRLKTAPTAEELAQDEADAPLMAHAKARNLHLYRQFSGTYYFVNLGSGGTLVRNPADSLTYDFSREEVIRYLGQMPE